jgi:hypothetical protein
MDLKCLGRFEDRSTKLRGSRTYRSSIVKEMKRNEDGDIWRQK